MSDLITRLRSALEDRYSIEKEIGEGGMATVYLAEDVRHHREVAVKVLRAELAATMGTERFLREIEIAAQLQHPHVLPLYDSGEAGGFLFYVMPYIEGESLRSKLDREGELPVGDAVRILRDVADALAYAHGRGVVHRDIKPDNVMLSGRHAMVTDFGVAKAVSEATGRQQQFTTAGVALGTPAYMAPEQAVADPHVDHRADLYAFGAMAYELFTGSPPFVGRTPQMVLTSHVTEIPVQITQHRAAVPEVLAEVVMRCLEKKPADRWQSAEELLPRFEVVATPSVGMTPTETRPVEAASQGGRRRNVVLAAVAGVALLAAAAVFFPRTEEVALANDRVLVGVFVNETGDPANDALGKIIADWLVRGLHETGFVEVMDERSLGGGGDGQSTDPVRLRSLAQAAGAGLIVSGNYYLTGESLQLQGQVLDARGGSIVSAIGPLTATVGAPQVAIAEMRDRMMGAFANILDPRFGAVAPGLSPPSYRAYQEFVAGDELFYQLRFAESAQRLMEAYRLDTTFAVAAVRAAVAFQNVGRCDVVDSIAGELNAKRQSVAPYDRYYLDRIVARCNADYSEHLRAGEEMMRVAPKSPFAQYIAGRSALWVNRVQYGLELLEAIDPQQGEMRSSYDQLMGDITGGHHQLSDYFAELAVLDRWEGWAEYAGAQSARVRVLAGLERYDEAQAAAEQAMSLSVGGGAYWPSDIVCHMAEEVLAHGGPEASLSARELCLDAIQQRGVAGVDSVGYFDRLGNALHRLDRLDEAYTTYEEILRLAPQNLVALGRLGVIAARRGDGSAAETWEARLEAYPSEFVGLGNRPGGLPSLWRAKVALARGDREQAIRLIRQAFNEGINVFSGEHGDIMHQDVDLRPLFGDPAYQEIVAPKP